MTINILLKSQTCLFYKRRGTLARIIKNSFR